MHKIDPNDMDALFREGADKHEFVYNPAAWVMMEEKLDRNDRRRTFLWYFLGLVIVVGSVFGFMHFTNNSNNIQHQVTLNETSDLENIQSNTSQLVDEKANNAFKNTTVKEEQKVKSTSQLSSNSNLISENIQKADRVTSKEIKEEYINTGSEVRSRNIGAQNSENTGSLVNDEVVSVAPPIIANDNSQEAINLFSNETSPSITNTRSQESQLSALSNKRTMDVFSLNTPNLDFNLTPQVSLNDKLAPIISVASRYVFTGYANAEFSSVGLFKKSRAGYKIGFKVGKQFSDKFQFDIGLAYSHKQYGAVGDEYTRDGGWGVDNVKPTWMDAKCDVLEIPLEISYYLNGFKNDGFFFNAGISSYLVNSEWYGFKYDESGMAQPEIDLLVKEINPDEITDMNYHLSGVGKLSVGYQKIVSPNMALEVSPYIQIPLTGIGEGKVNLYSTGIQFAVKFNSK